MSQSLSAARYRDLGGRFHDVLCRTDTTGCWQVLDHGPEGRVLVERLPGFDDGPEQAEALAQDYATQMQAHLVGLRSHPFPPRAVRAAWLAARKRAAGTEPGRVAA